MCQCVCLNNSLMSQCLCCESAGQQELSGPGIATAYKVHRCHARSAVPEFTQEQQGLSGLALAPESERERSKSEKVRQIKTIVAPNTRACRVF